MAFDIENVRYWNLPSTSMGRSLGQELPFGSVSVQRPAQWGPGL